ncbi:MAG: hypothetical protein HeimC3_33630 [Candidatus Heimdallarchaeota archaeon LC_3]|nr:MAG: hypothetical protein HeimC3_33630 [Candidatus Heimdallarchaeota archaeon LC_3]
MLDIGAFLINRVMDLIIGLVLGLIIGVIVSIFAYFTVEGDLKNRLIPRLLVIVTIVFGILSFIQMFLAELSVISYIDILQGGTGLIVIILTILLILVLIWYASYITEGEFLKSVNISGKFNSKKFQTYGGPIVFIVFIGIFASFFMLIFLEDFSFIFVIGIPLIFIILLIFSIRILVNRRSRRTLVLVLRRGKPALFVAIFILGSLIAIIGYFSFIHASLFAPVNQANYFNSFIETSTEDLFENEIRDDQLRLVDKELAQAIVNRHASIFGSNVFASSLHITTYDGKLVWVAAMAPDNMFNQELKGLLIVDANDPTKIPEDIVFDPGEAVISENLFYGAETKRVSWLQDPMSSYGRTYITWKDGDPDGDLVQIQTFNTPKLFEWITHYGGVKIYDMKGNLLDTYTDLATMPEWISQPFDEEWLENNIYNWGNLRQGNGFNIFASGFLGLVTPSADRLEISRDTRYIISPDTNETVAITPVHPSTNQLSNAGVFLSKNNSITYYDYHQRGYISAESIEQYVESQEPQVAQGIYYSTLPMLYTMNVGNDTRMAWFTPVYHKTQTYDSEGFLTTVNVQFRGLYILDAKKQEIFGRAYLSDYGTTSNMIAAAKTNYRNSVINADLGVDIPSNVTELLTVNITQKASYVANGTTFIAFKTNNSLYEYLIASPEELSQVHWLYALFDVEAGTVIKFTAFRENNSWILTSLQPA